MLCSFFSCEFLTDSGLKIDKEKESIMHHYFQQLEADRVEFFPLDQDWEEGEIPIYIINSKVVRYGESGQLINLEYVDSVATYLWDAVMDKEKYSKINFGII